MPAALTQRILISGCSGGGKSTLVDALHRNGFATVDEPGRRIVAEERAGDGRALPWRDPLAFAQRAVSMARADLAAAASLSGPVFFDRGLIDAAVALDHAGGPPVAETLGGFRPYDTLVFLAPPWADIYVQDADRPHGFDDAIMEHNRITAALKTLGYITCLLPKHSVDARVAFIVATLRLR